LTQIEGGEIGSGFSMTAMFELVPSLSLNEAANNGTAFGDLADIKVEYSLPGDSLRKSYSHQSKYAFTRFNDLEKCQVFSTAVAMFGSLLRSSQYTKNVEWNDVILFANASAADNDVQQKEFVGIVQKAKALYLKAKKKKNKSKEENEN